MPNKKLVPVLLILFLSHTFTVFAAKNCECGEHATGITTYTTGGDDCCKDTPGANGMQYTYAQEMVYGKKQAPLLLQVLLHKMQAALHQVFKFHL